MSEMRGDTITVGPRPAFRRSFVAIKYTAPAVISPVTIRTTQRNRSTSSVDLRKNADSGSPLIFHTESAWREISALVDAGMTPIEAISAATKTGAEILGMRNQLGTIEPGKLADVIVVRGNPLFDINVLGYVEHVVKGGVVYK